MMNTRASKQRWRIDLPSHDALEGLSEPQRLEIIKRLNARLNRHPATYVMTLGVMLVSMTAGYFFNWPITGWFLSLGFGRVAAHVIGAVITSTGMAIVGLVIGYWLIWSIHQRAFRTALREIGRDVCVECGYWLHGLDDAIMQCPECGAAREASEPSGAAGEGS